MASTTLHHQAVVPVGPGQDAGSASPYGQPRWRVRSLRAVQHRAMAPVPQNCVLRGERPAPACHPGATGNLVRQICPRGSLSRTNRMPRSDCGGLPTQARPASGAAHPGKQRRDYFSPYSVRKKGCRLVFCHTFGMRFREADSADSTITTGLGQRRTATARHDFAKVSLFQKSGKDKDIEFKREI